MSDDHLVFPEQQSAAAKERAPVPAERPAARANDVDSGADNRGRRAGATAAGEATGSGASAGGGGSPEDIDSDSAGGGGAVRVEPERQHPAAGGDAPAGGSA